MGFGYGVKLVVPWETHERVSLRFGYIGSDGKNTGMIYSLPASYAIIRCNLVWAPCIERDGALK